jgi:O-antigen biosynthesis protein WbqP
MYIKFKRAIDILMSFAGVVVLSPIFVLLIVWIKFDSKGPILFKQRRVGKDKESFYILKSKHDNKTLPKSVRLIAGKSRKIYTRAGKFLRKTSLDELPQLLNILRGEMSVIGPRPVLLNQVDLIEERDKYNANSVRPGLTGWAQVNGRDKIPGNIKAKLDGDYVKNISFLLDMKCFFMTIINVLKCDGVVEGKITHKNME